MLKLKRWLALVAILAGLTATTSLVPIQAARPGASVPAGKIYYVWYGAEPIEYWSMNSDGSGKQPLLYQHIGALSDLTHQGHRWLLELMQSPNFPNQAAVFAAREDGNDIVLLIDEPGVRMYDLRWGMNDSLVSIASIATITWPNGSQSSDPTALAHIHAATIAFDPDSGLPALTTPLVEVAEGEQFGYPDIRNHDWSPDGTEVVYELAGNPGIPSAMIADPVTGSARLLSADSQSPVWSPDGTRIAYSFRDGSIYTVNPNGTGLLKVTTNNSTQDLSRGWSPDGSYIMFQRFIVKNVKGVYVTSSDILLVPATGGSTVNLTKDIDGIASPVYWR